METDGVMLEGNDDGAEDGGVGDMYDEVGVGHCVLMLASSAASI